MKKFLETLAIILVCIVMLVSSFGVFYSIAGKPKTGTADTKSEEIQPQAQSNTQDESPAVQPQAPVQQESAEPQKAEETPQDTKEAAAPAGELPDPSSWSAEQIAKFYVDAINNTRAQKNDFTVDFKRTMTANITNCTGGSLVTKIANEIAQGSVKNYDEVLTYKGGDTKMSDGTPYPISIFSSANDTCSLDVSGLESITAQKTADGIVIKLKFKVETATMTEKPKYIAPAAGYFDFASVDTGAAKMQSADITYTGSEVEVTVNKDNLVDKAVYHVPVKIEAQGAIMGITANLSIEGGQDESWVFHR